MAIIPVVENNYVGDGSTRIYDTTFVYLDRADVYATVDGEPVAFTWLSDSSSQVELAVAPAAGTEVHLFRSTQAIDPRYEFAQGIPILPRYIDENNRQLLYAVQEGIASTADIAAEALGVAEDALEAAKRAEEKVDNAIILSAEQLRIDLATSSNPAKGAALVARGLQTFDTVAAMVAAASHITVGQTIVTRGYSDVGDAGGAQYIVQASSTEPAVFTVPLGAGKVAVLLNRAVSPLQVGYSLNAIGLDTPAKVAANWSVMQGLLAAIKVSGRRLEVPRPQATLRGACAEWLARRAFAIGFYSDSTTDGATTTGHIPSVGSTSPFTVTINESPNAYPAQIENYLKQIIGTDKPVRCYNGGFDSQSYQNGFGLRHWYNTWFRGTAGSNVDWSDVRMIVLGFGTSDSINQNNLGPVIDDYTRDLECTVIDCLLRGVTPVIQGPVLTTQKAGTTVNYRNGDESVTVIETVQKQLCQRYGLEHLSYREEVAEMLSGFSGMKYTDYMAVDMVHPNDLGHRVHAGYLISRFFPNLARLKPGQDIEHVFAGHNAYITTFNEVVSPPSRDGFILKTIAGVRSDDAYFYSWRAADGTAKAPGALLVRLPVYVDRPTNMYINNSHNSPPAARTWRVVSCTLDDGFGASITGDVYAEPVRTWNKRRLLARLPYGLNIIEFRVGATTGGDYQFVSTYLVDALRDIATLPPRRPGAGTGTYMYRAFQGYDVNSPYVESTGRAAVRPWDWYNNHDTVPLLMRTQLLAAPVGAFGFRTHYQDGTDWRNCYNQVSIDGDVVTTAVVANGASSTLDSQTIAGLGAMMVEGARIGLRFTSRFTSSQGVLVELLVNGVVRYTYSAALGAMWYDGYGFGSFGVARTGEVVTSACPVPVFSDIRYYI